MPNVGDTLTRNPKRKDARDSIKLVGVRDGSWLATPVEDFGPTFPMTARELVEDYGVSDPAPPAGPSDDDLRAFDAATNAESARAYGRAHSEAAAARRAEAAYAGPAANSPEGVFAAVTEGDDDDGDDR